MKILIFPLFLVASSIASAWAQTNIFKVGKIYTYDVASTFWPESGSSGDNSAAEEWKADYVMKVTVGGLNKIILQTEAYRIFGSNDTSREIPVSSSVRNELETPMEVTLDATGQPMSMKFQRNLSEWTLNIKKLEVSRFMLNTGASAERHNTNVKNQGQLEYTVQEKSIMGQCEVKYNVQEERLTMHWSLPSRSRLLPLNPTHDEPVNEVNGSHLNDENGSNSQQEQDMETFNEQNVWSSEEQEESHVEFIQRFCDANSKLYEFQKTSDLRYCQSTGNSGGAYTGITKTQYVACGPHRKNLTVLQISHQIIAEEEKLVEKITLVDVSDIDRSQIPIFSTSAVSITNFYKSLIGNEYDLRTHASNDVDRSNLLKLQRVQDSEGIQKYRACVQRNGAQPTKLVSRDLNSDYYNHLNLQWNLRKDKVYPVAYFLPATAQDVASAVKCGLESEIHLVANSGGHSYEAIGWGNNHTIVVDFRNMKRISIEGSGSRAVGRLEPGALVGPVNAYFWENGGYAMPMGNCMTVGMGGHAIGGGVGYFSTQYGLALDNVIEFEIVDGRGQIIVANHNTNPDLFWALRGAGPGYIGIVTSFKVKLFEAHKIKMTLVRLRYQIKHFATAYIAFQNMLKWIKVNEPKVFLGFMLASDTYNATQPPISPGIEFSALHIQDPNVQPKGNASFLKALFEIFPQPAEIIQSFPNYIQFVVMTGYAPIITPHATTGELMSVSRLDAAELYHNSHNTRFMDLPSDPEIIAFLKSMRKDNASPRYFKAKSFFVKKYFTLAQMERVAHVLLKIPQNNIWILCNSEQGAIHRVGKTDTAYVHRDAVVDFSIHYEGSADPGQVHEGMTYLYELWETLQFMDGGIFGETYQNYPDLDVKDHLVRNYGQNLKRLMEQKQKWDPTNFFVTQISLPILSGSQNSTIGVTSDESITLYRGTNYQGQELVLELNPGCKGILQGDWNDKTASVALHGQDQCIILWEHYYCRGISARVTQHNAEDAKDLKNFNLAEKLSSVQLCDAGKCTIEGFFVDPGNCNKFFRCVDIHQTGKEEDFVRYDFTCPPGQVFDEANSACNFPDRIHPPTPC